MSAETNDFVHNTFKQWNGCLMDDLLEKLSAGLVLTSETRTAIASLLDNEGIRATLRAQTLPPLADKTARAIAEILDQEKVQESV